MSQKDLVSVLYSVHNKLQAIKRQTTTDQEWQNAWKKHTSDIETLQEYSKAMHELATKIWDPRNKNVSRGGIEDQTPHNKSDIDSSTSCKPEKLKCRLEWVAQRCAEHFGMNRISVGNMCAEGDKLKLLDVGSCYNPFSQLSSYFDVLALDLCPAPGFEKEIYQCDFLELGVCSPDTDNATGSDKVNFNVTEHESNGAYKKLLFLPKDYFNVIVFSYFLEYLADSKQRLECCEKASQLLQPGGLLFILRPDSSKVTPGGNNRLIKKLKVGMALLGMKRIYFEKLEHLWCMGFKKLSEGETTVLLESSCFRKDFQKIGAPIALDNASSHHTLFNISQDSKQMDLYSSADSYDYDSTANSATDTIHHSEMLFKELPVFDFSLWSDN